MTWYPLTAWTWFLSFLGKIDSNRETHSCLFLIRTAPGVLSWFCNHFASILTLKTQISSSRSGFWLLNRQAKGILELSNGDGEDIMIQIQWWYCDRNQIQWRSSNHLHERSVESDIKTEWLFFCIFCLCLLFCVLLYLLSTKSFSLLLWRSKIKSLKKTVINLNSMEALPSMMEYMDNTNH